MDIVRPTFTKHGNPIHTVIQQATITNCDDNSTRVYAVPPGTNSTAFTLRAPSVAAALAVAAAAAVVDAATGVCVVGCWGLAVDAYVAAGWTQTGVAFVATGAGARAAAGLAFVAAAAA